MKLQTIFAVIIKEFLEVWRDRRTRLVLIVPPLLQLFLFSYAATLEVKNIELAVLNQDQGKHSFEVIQRLIGSPYFKKVYFLERQQDVDQALDQQRALMAVKFPTDFTRKIEHGKTASVQVILDGRKSNAATIAGGYINNILEGYNTELVNKNAAFKAISVLIPRHWFNANLEYTWFTVPTLIAILGMVIALALTSLSIAREREMGTFEQLLVSPITPTQILIGKTIPAIILALFESTLLLLCALFIFGIPFQGSLFLFYGSMIIFLLSVIGIGLFISSLCRTQQQAVIGTFLFMAPSTTISGFATPVENMPLWLQYFSELVPFKHFQIVTRGLFLKDLPFELVFQNTWPNILISLFTLTMAVFFFRQRLE